MRLPQLLVFAAPLVLVACANTPAAKEEAGDGTSAITTGDVNPRHVSHEITAGVFRDGQTSIVITDRTNQGFRFSVRTGDRVTGETRAATFDGGDGHFVAAPGCDVSFAYRAPTMTIAHDGSCPADGLPPAGTYDRVPLAVGTYAMDDDATRTLTIQESSPNELVFSIGTTAWTGSLFDAHVRSDVHAHSDDGLYYQTDAIEDDGKPCIFYLHDFGELWVNTSTHWIGNETFHLVQ